MWYIAELEVPLLTVACVYAECTYTCVCVGVHAQTHTPLQGGSARLLQLGLHVCVYTLCTHMCTLCVPVK